MVSKLVSVLILVTAVFLFIPDQIQAHDFSPAGADNSVKEQGCRNISPPHVWDPGESTCLHPGLRDPVPQFGTIGDIFTAVISSIYVVAGMVSLLFLIWGGIRYMTARGDPKAIDAARGTITSAVIGLLIIFLIGVIFVFIKAVLKIDILGGAAVYASHCGGSSADIGCKFTLSGQSIAHVFPTFGGLFTNIIRFALAAAALIFFFMVIWGGFRYLNAGGDPKNAESARGTLTSAGIGLLIVVLSLVIIEIITSLFRLESIFG